MGKFKKATEFDLLRLFVNRMEEKGVTRAIVRLDVGQEAVGLLLDKFKVHCTVEELQHLADKCLAHEWLEHAYLGTGKYEALTLTMSGHGVVRSLQMKEATKAKRSALKKVSDLIEDHKGVSAAVGVLIAIIGLLIKLGG